MKPLDGEAKKPVDKLVTTTQYLRIMFSPRYNFLTFFLIAGVVGCGKPTLLNYTLDVPAQTLAVISAPTVSDGRVRFREIFCGLLAAEHGTVDIDRWCEGFLLRLSDEPAPTSRPKPPPSHDTQLRLVLVPGLFGECVSRLVTPFEVAAKRLQDLGYEVETLIVSGQSGSGHNAKMIAQAVANSVPNDNEKLVLLGHSKGAVDILQFLVDYPELAQRVAAVVSVAGAINGSPVAEKLAGYYEKLPAFGAFGECEPGDHEALKSLKRSVRLTWLANHPLPTHVQYFSLVAFTQRERITEALLGFYDVLAEIDPRNDGQLLFFDQVIPGATLLGYANADHWMVAHPLEDKILLSTNSVATRQPFPRTVLLEAIILYVAETLAQTDPAS